MADEMVKLLSNINARSIESLSLRINYKRQMGRDDNCYNEMNINAICQFLAECPNLKNLNLTALPLRCLSAASQELLVNTLLAKKPLTALTLYLGRDGAEHGNLAQYHEKYSADALIKSVLGVRRGGAEHPILETMTLVTALPSLTPVLIEFQRHEVSKNLVVTQLLEYSHPKLRDDHCALLCISPVQLQIPNLVMMLPGKFYLQKSMLKFVNFDRYGVIYTGRSDLINLAMTCKTMLSLLLLDLFKYKNYHTHEMLLVAFITQVFGHPTFTAASIAGPNSAPAEATGVDPTGNTLHQILSYESGMNKNFIFNKVVPFLRTNHALDYDREFAHFTVCPLSSKWA